MYAAMNMCRDGWRDVIGGGGGYVKRIRGFNRGALKVVFYASGRAVCGEEDTKGPTMKMKQRPTETGPMRPGGEPLRHSPPRCGKVGKG